MSIKPAGKVPREVSLKRGTGRKKGWIGDQESLVRQSQGKAQESRVKGKEMKRGGYLG